MNEWMNEMVASVPKRWWVVHTTHISITRFYVSAVHAICSRHHFLFSCSQHHHAHSHNIINRRVNCTVLYGGCKCHKTIYLKRKRRTVTSYHSTTKHLPLRTLLRRAPPMTRGHSSWPWPTTWHNCNNTKMHMCFDNNETTMSTSCVAHKWDVPHEGG